MRQAADPVNPSAISAMIDMIARVERGIVCGYREADEQMVDFIGLPLHKASLGSLLCPTLNASHTEDERSPGRREGSAVSRCLQTGAGRQRESFWLMGQHRDAVAAFLATPFDQVSLHIAIYWSSRLDSHSRGSQGDVWALPPARYNAHSMRFEYVTCD